MRHSFAARARASVASWNATVVSTLQANPWMHWAFVYAVGHLYYFSYRCLITPELLATFGAKDEHTAEIKLAGVWLGVVEDFIALTCLVVLLWGCDSLLRLLPGPRRAVSILKYALQFVAYLVLFVVFVAPFCADTVLMRTRQLRFTFDWVHTYLNQRDAAHNLQVGAVEVRIAMHALELTLAIAVLFSAIGVLYLDLSHWSPLHAIWKKNATKRSKPTTYIVTTPSSRSNGYVDMERGDEEKSQNTEASHDDATFLTESHTSNAQSLPWRSYVESIVMAGSFLVVLPIIALAIAHNCSPVVANVALNTILNEAFRLWIHTEFLPSLASGDIASASNSLQSPFIHASTENFTLFGEASLYRRTTGFRGPLAFNVSVDPHDPPNVLVIVVESFRARDSAYLVGNSTYLLNGDPNITITPDFDRWARRGIAFSNFWSSYRTSRSLESILFGQIPYDSVTDSGITGGKTDVELAGLPQFFKAKGYETTYMSGCRTDYDQWNKFLPAHGFDEVLARNEVKVLAEKDLGITPAAWLSDKEGGGERRAHSYWGPHDDISFEVLGNILINKTEAQTARVNSGTQKTPFFLTHYTISSHTPFREYPAWWDEYPKPDFTSQYEGRTHAETIRAYLELRYFQNLALGKFLDRMKAQGVLDDTIVVIVGDHGQAPELGLDVVEPDQTSTTHVAAALIAEGRLGDDAGTIVEDAAEQYDLFNTLADIVGLPEGGFIQSGVGRSLKRAVPFGDRIVWSNNPSRKFAAIRGHHRIEYDHVSSEISMYDVETDHFQTRDLYPTLDETEKAGVDAIREAGRQLNMYFKNRWDKKCILAVAC
uniref:Sulfatase N-terminal domain-containing protein n=1 Tax=Globisporangium ultimum (strain ATCC 200006 / CBS 805.95 / DAOM BR144) TaxID=431595 RepID=K3X1T6_GLOUD